MLRTTEAVIATLLLGGTATSPPHQAQPQTLAYVNSAVILQSTPGVTHADSAFQRAFAGFQARVVRLQARFDTAAFQFNRVASALTPEARQRRQQELAQLQQRTDQEIQALRDSAQARRDSLMAPITRRVTAVIDGIRAERNYAIVFDVATQPSGIVSADPTLDISQLVIQRLQAAAQPSGSPPGR